MNSAALGLAGSTRPEWGVIAAADLPALLSDHAVCEQQAALNALSLIGTYGDDAVLVEKLGALAQEEVVHFRRVTALLSGRGWPVYAYRKNVYASRLRKLARTGREPEQFLDRMLISALIEARSAERFALLVAALQDDEARAMLADFAPAEDRHFELFLELAARRADAATLAARWHELAAAENEINAALGRAPRIHG